MLWIPFFYLFRRSIAAESGAGGVWALILGSITAIFQFLLGNFVQAGGFGLSRWMSGFVDIVALPVLIPFVIYIVCIAFRFFSGNFDFANFALLWMIPSAALHAISWSSQRSPILLLLVPLLWTALAVGIPLFINLIIQYFRWFVVILCALCILALPLLAVSAYWAFFSQQLLRGFLFFALTMIPMIISMIYDFVRAK